MSLVCGLDVGSTSTKAVMLRNGNIESYEIIPTGYNMAISAREVIEKLYGGAGVEAAQVARTVATGYGREVVAFADATATEITCHARGVGASIPGARVVIDIGGQDSKVIRLGPGGSVLDFIMNDKCAAGTGKLLENTCSALQLDISEMGAMAMESIKPVTISSTCAVFAESEVVTFRVAGVERADIAAGILEAFALRIISMSASIKWEPEVVFTGGVAKNIGMKKALEKRIGMQLVTPEEPQITGALGAAMIAQEGLQR